MATDSRKQQHITNSVTQLWEADEKEKSTRGWGEGGTRAIEKTLQNNSSRDKRFFEVKKTTSVY